MRRIGTAEKDWNSGDSLLFEILGYGHRVTKFGAYWDEVDFVVALMIIIPGDTTLIEAVRIIGESGNLSLC